MQAQVGFWIKSYIFFSRLFSWFSNFFNSLVNFTDMKLVWQEEYFINENERQADVGFPRDTILFPRYVKEFWTHVLYMWLAESLMHGWGGCDGRSEAIILTDLLHFWFSLSGELYIFLWKVRETQQISKPVTTTVNVSILPERQTSFAWIMLLFLDKLFSKTLQGWSN